ncbi:MAG TPA: DUF2723 domain-containing protein [Longimicrobiales bacterium]
MKQTMEARRAPRPAVEGGEGEAYRPPYVAAGVAVLAVFTLYAVTLARTTQFWDTSEYIATAHILGIPHPPGNPLFVVLARAWELLLAPTGFSVAVRINLFSATMSALAHGFWFLVMHRVAAFLTPNRTVRLVAAGVAVLVSATAFTVWNQSNVNEKVYTVSLFTIALLSWLAFRWRDNLGQGKDDNLLLLMIFVLALSVGNHLMAFLVAPSLALFVLMVAPRTLLNWRLYAAAAAVAVLGLSIHLFLPLRASLDPVINEADPSTWTALLESLTRKQYSKPSVLADPTQPGMPRSLSLFVAQLGNYFQYFDWQWARSVAGPDPLFGGARPLFTLAFLLLGLYGALVHYRKDRTSWAFIGILFLTLSFGLTFYLNFRYGYSFATDRFPDMEMHEVRERDYFFIVGFSVWGLWAGLGVVALWQRVAAGLREHLAGAAARPRRAQLLAAPVLALAFVPLVLNWSWASRAHDYSARDWAYNLLMSVEPYAVLFTNGDNDTFPLWYLQEVEGIRRDVTVIVMSYLNTPWYVKQLRQLTTPCAPGQSAADDPTRIICQRPFEPEEAPGFYKVDEALTEDRPGQPALAPAPGRRPPTRSIIQLTDQQIDEIANTGPFITQEAHTFAAGAIETTIPRGTIMIPADIFLGFIITNAIDDRPIYFATTTQAYEELNLWPYLIRQGVAFKLHNGPVNPDSLPGVVALPESPLTPIFGPYLDLERTDSLLWNVFQHAPGFPDEWTHWVDRPTRGIPNYYAYAHYAAAQGHALRGDTVQAARHMQRAEAWLSLARK